MERTKIKFFFVKIFKSLKFYTFERTIKDSMGLGKAVSMKRVWIPTNCKARPGES